MRFGRCISMLTLAAYAAATLLSSGAVVACQGTDGQARLEFAGVRYECCQTPAAGTGSCCDEPEHEGIVTGMPGGLAAVDAREGTVIGAPDGTVIAAPEGCSDTPLSLIAKDQSGGQPIVVADGPMCCGPACALPDALDFVTGAPTVASHCHFTCATGPPAQAMVLLC